MKLRSHATLMEFMQFRNLANAYQLGKAAGILPGTAHHLVSGARETCSKRTAQAIEEALGCPEGFLFVQEELRNAHTNQLRSEDVA